MLIAPQTETESPGPARSKRCRPEVGRRGKDKREMDVWYLEKGNGNKGGRGSGEGKFWKTDNERNFL
jgi:hypothetical protein